MISSILRVSLGLLALCAFKLQAQDGWVDTSFNPDDAGFSQGQGFDNEVRALAIQPDGKVIVGGQFWRYDGTGPSQIARLSADGVLDETFNQITVGDTVYALAVQPDGKILVAGPFDAWTQGTVTGITRLLANGDPDPSFLGIGTGQPLGAGGPVYALAVQPDGRILIGGDFYQYDGNWVNRIARLNTDGTLDGTFSAGSGPNGRVNSIAVQSDGKIIIGGAFTSVNSTSRGRIARLNVNGTLDATFTSGAGAGSGSILTIRPAPGGAWLVGGSFTSFDGTARHRLARISSSGSLDASFDPGSGANGTIFDIKVRPDGKIIVAGAFDQFNGVARPRLAQLLPSGALDAIGPPTFGPNGTIFCVALLTSGQLLVGGDQDTYGNRYTGHLTKLQSDFSQDLGFGTPKTGVLGDFYASVYCTAEQPDGKLLLAGPFDGYNGYAHHGIARCLPDGTVDQTFDPNTPVKMMGIIYDMVVQPDGKILIAGYFTDYNGIAQGSIARLNSDGSLDGTFNPGTGTDGSIEDLALLPSGKILISGGFNSFNGSAVRYLARLNSDGSLDATFMPGTGPNNGVEDLIVQPNGKILIVGWFTSVNGVARGRIARLEVDGALDMGFAPPGASHTINAATMVSGDKVIITGVFTSYNGTSRMRIARLLPDGTLDTSFDPGSGLDGHGRELVTQPDGSVIVLGSFYNYNGISRRNILRLSPSGSLDENLRCYGYTYTECATVLSDGDILFGGGFDSYWSPGQSATGRNYIARINGIPRMNVRTMLEGPYASGTMTDALRSLPSFPLTEPFTAMGYSNPTYTPGSGIAASVLSATGNNAIVDWVIVEMRPVATPGTVAASRAVLLQRDGDVVDLDGRSAIAFPGLYSGNYCVALRSRNHLSVMSSPTTPVSYGSSSASVDFTLPSTVVYDNDARQNIGGTMVLAAGDVNFNGIVQYVGSGNDRDVILTRIGGIVPTNTVSGYHAEDVNMDGVVMYTGSGNDRDLILQSIGGTVPTNTRVAVLP